MILIVAAALCIVSVPLTGGDLGRLGGLRLRGLWLPLAALAAQVAITTVARSGDPELHRRVHEATYVLLIGFALANRRLPGAPIIALGVSLNALAILVNGGVMPASATAQRLAGLTLAPGFHNSGVVAHPLLLWLGDVIPWPGPLPNVLSVGDLFLYAGTAVLLHRVCRARPAAVLATEPKRSAASEPIV